MVLISLLLSCVVPTTCVYGQDKWDVADANVTRLSPEVFSRLPKPIMRYLKVRHCTIPQVWYESKPHNVIRGMFAKPHQYDWAVLCSRNKVSTILVFWGGSTRNPAKIASAPDKGYLQRVGGEEYGGIGFSRVITAVDRKYVLDHYREYGGPRPPPIDHQGIDDGYEEKASVVLYYYRRRWLELQGAD
jgi:hypothetical protein